MVGKAAREKNVTVKAREIMVSMVEGNDGCMLRLPRAYCWES